MDESKYRAVANVMVEGLTVYYGKVYTEEELSPSLDELLRSGCVVACIHPSDPAESFDPEPHQKLDR